MIRNTRKIHIGKLELGGDSPVRIQGMLKTPLDSREKLREEAVSMRDAGAEIIRCALPSVEAVAPSYEVLKDIGLPLVADCHFQSAIALKAIQTGFSKIRLNPGNIDRKGLVSAINMAKDHNIALRFGFNGGSFEAENGISMAQAALELDHWIKEQDFNDYVVSLKLSSAYETVQANRFFSMKSDTPLHIGVTATGPRYEGIIKSAAGLGSLIMDGIGDTVRVSLTGDSIEEIKVARILRQLISESPECLELISCPTCSRSRIDVVALMDEFKSELMEKDYRIPKKLAIMGCEVNGPGEAREADMGICGSKKGGLLIARGEIVRFVQEKDIVQVLLDELRRQ